MAYTSRAGVPPGSAAGRSPAAPPLQRRQRAFRQLKIDLELSRVHQPTKILAFRDVIPGLTARSPAIAAEGRHDDGSSQSCLRER